MKTFGGEERRTVRKIAEQADAERLSNKIKKEIKKNL